MNNPRIITGKYKGMQLKVPDSARPITDRVKKTVFDVLGEQIQGVDFLDLFAGSGSLGIEALSNGAESGTFVDIDKEAIATLENNLRRIDEPTEVINKNYRWFLKHIEKTYKLIFIDPPFEKIQDLDWRLIQNALSPNGIIIFKSNYEDDQELAKSLTIVDKRKIGINYIYFLCLKA